MDNTKIDDMLIEMISPKVKEIQERFSKGEGLSNEDINTLLLKSQYNHINHLDKRLDEVTADVSSLKTDFKRLEFEVNSKLSQFENKLGQYEIKLDAFEVKFNARFDSFEKSFELKIQQAINVNMRWSIGLIALLVTILKVMDTILK